MFVTNMNEIGIDKNGITIIDQAIQQTKQEKATALEEDMGNLNDHMKRILRSNLIRC